MKHILNYIKKLKTDSFEGWSDDEKNGYLTACVSIEEKILSSEKEYIYNVRRVYNSSTDIEKFNNEIEKDGWEIVKMMNLRQSSYILFNIRKEK